MSQTAITDVLPRPVGNVHVGGMLSGRPDTNRSCKAHCQGKWPFGFPVRAAKMSRNWSSVMRQLLFTLPTAGATPCFPFRLDSVGPTINNARMVVRGRVHNGVVVLEGNPALPEGAAVTVTYPAPAESPPAAEKRRVEFPLVRSARPGSVHLTGERIAE